MVLTRDFKETVAARVRADAAFVQALRDEAAALRANGETECAEMVLRDLEHAAGEKAEISPYPYVAHLIAGVSCRR